MKTIGWAVLAAALCISAAGAEDKCGTLVSYGTIPITQIEGHSSEFVPVEINGIPRLMMLDTGAGVSMLTNKAAAELHLEPRHSVEVEAFDVTGARSDMMVKAPIKIGSLRGDKVNFMLGTPYVDDFGDSRIAGLLGGDILRNFDVSIDYGAHSFTLLNQNHCDGQVVYWPERPIAVVPFRLGSGAAIFFPVKLDGHELWAQIDTGAYHSVIGKYKVEHTFFDLVLGSADAPVIDEGGKDRTRTWRHRFKTLSLAGLEVNNPEIDIIFDPPIDGRRVFEGSLQHILIGMNVLKHLHLYIAYKEKKLYITPAAAPAK